VVTDNARVVQGVELRRSGDLSTKFVRSHREVVLSAGAINTPHILLQSGVGPQAHLRKHRVSFSDNSQLFQKLNMLPLLHETSKELMWKDIYNNFLI
jgi:choline dehydrogenase-like flavoprotein